MWLSFTAALTALGAGAAFRIANTARSGADYLLASLLPERNMFTYHVEAGNMTVRSTMAGMVGMDSPYPPGGLIDLSTFAEKTVKIANHVALTEQNLRSLQEMLMRLQVNGAPTTEVIQREALNFLDKVIIQPHLDRAEWMRGRALLGSISWEFGGKELTVNYGIPAANLLANRTGASAYGGASSTFWADMTLLRRALRGRMRLIIARSETLDAIRYNSANSLAVVGDVNGVLTFRRLNAQGQLTQDVGDMVQVIAYDREGDIIDPANPGKPIHVPFLPIGKLIAIAANDASGYTVGQGSTDDPSNANELGYTHIAPTVEGGGQPGRWADLFTPELEPWSLHGRGASNILPVIEAPDKIAVASTDVA